MVTRPRLLIIAALAEAAGLSVCVDDAGVGLKEQVLKRIFEPFYTSKVHGTGIGLAIGHSIIEAHGGHLRAERKHVRGATFKFSLPFEEARAG